MTNPELGSRISSYRQNKNMTQEELANKMDISRQTISKWETDETIPDIQYQKEVNIPNYARRLSLLLDELKKEYHYSELDAFLVLKDILGQFLQEVVWQLKMD